MLSHGLRGVVTYGRVSARAKCLHLHEHDGDQDDDKSQGIHPIICWLWNALITLQYRGCSYVLRNFVRRKSR